MKRKTALLWAATILYTLLIFSFSLMKGSSSDSLSQGGTFFLMPFLRMFGLSFEDSHVLMRKLAHFGEYYILLFFVRAASENTFPKKGAMLCIILYGILAPVLDETIQLFVPGRAGALMDVMIDMSGYFAAWATASLIRQRINGQDG